jgi:AraC-like DNA-binding protein
MLNYYEFVKSHPEEYKQISCKDLLFVLCECPADFKKSEDWSEHNIFIYIISGQVILHSRERTWHLQQGDTVFMKKGGCAIEKTDYDSFCSLLFYVPDTYIRSFTMDKAGLLPVQQVAPITRSLVIPVDTDPVLTAFFNSVISYFISGTHPSEDLVELKFKELLLNIISNPANKELAWYFYRLGLNDTDDLRDVMERNCLYNLQLHEYARLCHRSLSSFKRDFGAAYGQAPGRWLLEKRLDHACQLLMATRMPVMDVVTESGFKNISHFDAVFKNHFGFSPLQYRKHFSPAPAVPLLTALSDPMS